MNDIKTLLQEAHEQVGPGWWPIIDKYLPQIAALAPEAEILVKEKYGTLRIRAYGQTLDRERVMDLEDEAQRASATVCEECGDPGKFQFDLCWIKVLCDECNQKARSNKDG